ncbi:class I SAM-dependent methyltransferase [Nocardia sp. 2]|uniref:Class I SAM-dependent methyltransferase n=1 Tax=Nocardia acididurans TaxID=2802282 RepID=A0ABS1MBK3_9NOCA|nr:class I SAM-dependent methyltransferase [Nocardia acididurans]MBL1078002.1 class I SAM-dependent methyltransferase [Nocardia acididurans]
MSRIVNTAQSQAWNGYEGTHWADHFDRYDAINAGFNESLLSAACLTADSRILDIGCGTGQLTREAARRAPRGIATGIDLSGPMLARARERAGSEGIATIAFEQGDAQVFPFPAGEFDAALSRFGIMFFADPVAAFSNIARALRPGGRLAFVTMPPMTGTDLGTVFGAAATHLPTFEISHTHGPLADRDGIRALLTAAGCTDIAVDYLEADGIWGRDIPDATEFIMGWGPVRHHRMLTDPAFAGSARAVTSPVAANSGPPSSTEVFAIDDQVRAAVAAALAPFATPDGIRLRGTAWLVTATTPLP